MPEHCCGHRLPPSPACAGVLSCGERAAADGPDAGPVPVPHRPVQRGGRDGCSPGGSLDAGDLADTADPPTC
ncbi:hypothetical protein FM106_26905 [Brachybacterium faecium]|nr:hypothetical protein FM106_26905 [Brachybacterium faecium]